MYQPISAGHHQVYIHYGNNLEAGLILRQRYVPEIHCANQTQISHLKLYNS
jgi:hypothetical protein